MTVSFSPSPIQPSPPPTHPLLVNWKNALFFASIHLLALLGFWCFSWKALAVAVFLHWLCGSLGICLGYHRLLSHRSFQVPQWLEYIFAFLGCLAVQGGPIFWVGGHRQHHAFTEHVDKDPYSSKRGFWWSHMLWVIFTRPEYFELQNYQRLAPDLSRDPVYRFFDKYFLLFQIPLAALLYALGGWPFVVYGIFVRLVVLWHSTWLINSATHLWGTRRFDSNDNSRNLWWAAILTYGEGWHNNHHADPKCAKAGLSVWEVDMTYGVIWILQKLGLATKVHLPSS
jgi:stearoyl-CoA desaturase (delta-9 desaturase)